MNLIIWVQVMRFVHIMSDFRFLNDAFPTVANCIVMNNVLGHGWSVGKDSRSDGHGIFQATFAAFVRRN